MGRRKHILLVDDEKEFLFSAAMALRSAGYVVTIAGGGADALRLLRCVVRSGNDVDLLVTDIQMDGMSGKELVRTVRLERPSLPVLLITGYLDADLGEALAMEGCVGHLLKPFDPREFVSRIACIVNPPGKVPALKQGG